MEANGEQQESTFFTFLKQANPRANTADEFHVLSQRAL
jgi:hypothetical protein